MTTTTTTHDDDNGTTKTRNGNVMWIDSTHGLSGMLWFAGWLFTIGFAKLGLWNAILGLIAWPYFLGTTFH